MDDKPFRSMESTNKGYFVEHESPCFGRLTQSKTEETDNGVIPSCQPANTGETIVLSKISKTNLELLLCLGGGTVFGGGIRLPSFAITVIAGGALIDIVSGTPPTGDSSLVSCTVFSTMGAPSSVLAYRRSSGVAFFRLACKKFFCRQRNISH